MAVRGRKPKTVAEKALAGNPGRRSLKTALPAAPARELLCPSHVQGDDIALAYWDWYTRHAVPGHLAAIDSHMLAELCTYQALWDRHVAEMRETGLTSEVVTQRGETLRTEIKGNPLVREMARVTAQIRALAADLCLTVADRNRIGTGEKDKGHGPKDTAAGFIR